MRVAALLFACMVASGQAPTVNDFTVSGVVVDHVTNQSLNHVLVQLISVRDGADASVITEGDGRFNFIHVPRGKYQLMAQKRGQMPQGFNSDGGYSTAVVVDGRMKTDNILFSLRTDSSISGTVTGDDGEPFAEAQVALFRETVNDGEPQTVQSSGGNTTSSGHFHFGHLEPGKYYVAVTNVQEGRQVPGESNPPVYPVTFYGNTTDARTAQAIVVQEGHSASIEIGLHSVPSIRVKIPDVQHGVALFAPGPGDTEISVPTSIQANEISVDAPRGRMMAQGVSVDGSRHGDGPPPPIALPDQSGVLFNLPAGHYKVMSFNDKGQTGASQEVDLADGSTLSTNHASTMSGSISGRVLFSGNRPEHLAVFLSNGQPGAAQVQADGTFKIENVPPGTYGVHLNDSRVVVASVAAKGARISHDNLIVPSGAAVDLTIQTVAGEALEKVDGFAVRDGAGVAGAMVLLVPQDLSRTQLMRRDQSDADGSFTLPSALPGRYTAVAIDDGRDLAYKEEAQIKPYLAGGVSVTVPLASKDPIQVPIQARR